MCVHVCACVCSDADLYYNTTLVIFQHVLNIAKCSYAILLNFVIVLCNDVRAYTCRYLWRVVQYF